MGSVARLQRFVGNPNAYALQQPDGTYRPVREPLTAAVLRRHLDGDITVGTYVLHGDRARTLVLDVDEDDDELVQQLYGFLEDLGLRAGVEKSGRKGWHIWVLVGAYVSAHHLRRIGMAARALVSNRRVEVFPKQDRAEDLGNLVKLPWGVHRVTGVRSDFTAHPVPVSVADITRAAEQVAELNIAPKSVKAPPPFFCMERIQQGVSEGQRNVALFHFTVMLRRAGLGSDLIEESVRAVNRRFEPPLEDLEVEAVLRSAQRSGPLCRTLEGSDLHCGEHCILARYEGLYTRPGRVRFAAEGEPVVVRVCFNDGNTVEFEHEDLAAGWGRLKNE